MRGLKGKALERAWQPVEAAGPLANSGMGKLFRYARVFWAWRMRGSDTLAYLPEDISIELTNTCNFRCSFCPQSDPKHFEVVSRSALDVEGARVLLGKLRSGGVRSDVLHWTLDGEPFANRQIGEICELAIEFGFRNFIFSTNGYFCTEDRLNELPRGDGDVRYQLCIDFCASQALFEKHRGTRSSWGKVKENIERLMADDSQPHIALQVTDISSFEVITSQSHVDGLAALRALLGPESDRLKVSGRIFHNATGHVPEILESKQAAGSKYNLCPYPWTSMVIASNGDVVACCRDLQHKTVLGNLFEQELAEIWNGERYAYLRRALVEQAPERANACRNCDLPFDAGKFSLTHLVRTGVHRLGMFR